MTKENKEVLVKRLKSFLWRLGAYVAVAVIGFLINNLELVNLPPTVVAVVALILGEITKYIKVNLPELRSKEQ